MIVVLKKKATKKQISELSKRIKKIGLKPHVSAGEERTIIGIIGDERKLKSFPIELWPGVEKVMPILSPYKLVGRSFKEKNTVVNIGGVKIGGKEIIIMAGPCAVENEEVILKTAAAVKKAGAKILRGGAFKPRTSPYDFQGLGEEGLKILALARKKTGLKIVTEVMDTRTVELVARYADILQIGARNIQNFALLKEVGKTKKPVLLKRGLASTIKEFLMSAEYILSEGNPNVILCERGIRTFGDYARNTADLASIPIIKELSHLPIVVDPSHATGKWSWVPPLSRAAVAVGADGLMIEVHPNPEKACSDGAQTLKPKVFEALMKELKPIAKAIGRTL